MKCDLTCVYWFNANRRSTEELRDVGPDRIRDFLVEYLDTYTKDGKVARPSMAAIRHEFGGMRLSESTVLCEFERQKSSYNTYSVFSKFLDSGKTGSCACTHSEFVTIFLTVRA